MAAPGYPPPGAAVNNPAVLRSPAKCFLLLLLSGGLWSFAWVYHTTKEVSTRVRPGVPGPGARAALYLIPIYNLVLLFQMWEDIDNYAKRARSQDFNVVLFFVLSLLIPFAACFTYPMVQSRMNDAHRAATNGAATDAPMETIDWVFVGIGLAFLALWLLLIIVAIIAAAGS